MRPFSLTQICDMHRGSVSVRSFVSNSYGVPYSRWKEIRRGQRSMPSSLFLRICRAHELYAPHVLACLQVRGEKWPLPYREFVPAIRRRKEISGD